VPSIDITAGMIFIRTTKAEIMISGRHHQSALTVSLRGSLSVP
jgi:hypothetical protein